MRILLVQPRHNDHLPYSLNVVVEPLALEILAASLPSRHEVRIVDLRLEAKGYLEEVLASFQPELVGISCIFTCLITNTIRTVQQIRLAAPQAFVIVGGHAPTMAPEHLDIPELDAIAIGEWDYVFPLLVTRLEKGQEWRDLPGLVYRSNGSLIHTQPNKVLVDDLVGLPVPARHLIADYAPHYHRLHGHPLALVGTSRGCPFRCTFCAVGEFYEGRIRTMPGERAAREIESARNYYIMLTDDNFMMDVQRAGEIAEVLGKHGMAGEKRYFCQTRTDMVLKAPDVIRAWKDIGMSEVFIGVEGVDADHLSQYKKRVSVDQHRQAIELLHKLELNVWTGLIVDPDFEEQDFERMRRFMIENAIEYPLLAILTPYPGTELWREHYQEFTTYNWDYFDTMHPILPTKLPQMEFYRRYVELHSTFYRGQHVQPAVSGGSGQP